MVFISQLVDPITPTNTRDDRYDLQKLEWDDGREGWESHFWKHCTNGGESRKLENMCAHRSGITDNFLLHRKKVKNIISHELKTLKKVSEH